MENYLDTVQAQFANSPTILSLIDSFNQSVDPTALIDLFYDNIFNLDTAIGYGLDLWGRIVGVSRVLHVANGLFFGFQGAGTSVAAGFNQSPFFTGAGATSNYALDDDSFRTLIYAKALANISDGSIPSLNNILQTLFAGRGNAYVADGDLSMTYTFSFALTPVEYAIVATSGVLPQVSGVAVSYAHP